YLPLGDGWEESLKPKHRSNMRNRLKRLGAVGKVELELVSSGEQLAGALEDGFRIEAAAWKGAAGTAIAWDPAVRRFYTRLAGRMAGRNALRLHFLRVGGRRIAFDYTLQSGGKLYLLKTGYDPAYGQYSPGHLQVLLALRDARACG